MPINRRCRFALVAALAALPATTPALATNWSATVVASGLNNPRGLAFGNYGVLYIAEAGYYAPGGPTTVVRGQTYGYADTGSITRYSHGSQTRILTGLPSLTSVANTDASGPNDIVFKPDGRGYVVVGLGTNPAARSTDLSPVGAGLGKVYAFDGNGITSFADVAAYEGANNPAGGAFDSNPFHAAADGDDLLVADAGANALLRISPSGDVSLVAAFPPRFIGPPVPFSDSVTTSVVVGPDGNYYVSELTGFPFTQGQSRIYQVTPGGTVSIAYTGFTMISDLAFGSDGSLYVLEVDSNGLATPGGTGQISRILPGGSRSLIWSNLVAPTGLAIDAADRLYVTNFSGSAGIGEVLRIAAVPEPGSWAMLIAGFGIIGAAARRQRLQPSAAA